MRFSVMLLLGFLVPFTSAAADAASGNQVAITSYVPQTSRVSMTCFPDKLRVILVDLGKQFGRQVVVTSGHRQTRGTRRGSQHRTCKAADIRIKGISPGQIARAALRHPLVGGVGTYCGKQGGIVHVDVGPRRTWHYCGSRRVAKRR